MSGQVIAVSSASEHVFSKSNRDSIYLVEGHGVEGDAHFGPTMRHVYLRKKDPTAPNVRQVHLMHSELFGELREKGFEVRPGELGENITTRNINLLGLPTGARLTIGDAVIVITGVRRPCIQIDGFQKGLVRELNDKDESGKVIMKSGIMGIILASGTVKTNDEITVELPPEPHQPLKPV